MPDASPRHPATAKSFKWHVQRVFASAYLEVVVGVMVVISVALTLTEFIQTTPDAEPSLWLTRTNDGITAIFILELGLRALVVRSKRRYLNEYFLDIVAVLPFSLILPGGRALRMLRLVRLLRMFGVVSRLSGHFPYIIRRGAVEYVMVTGLLVLTIVFATGAIMFFENQGGRDQPSFDLEDSFWFSIYSLFAGEPIPGPPQTLGGKIVAVFVMFMGLTIFAMFTGTVSAFMVERLQMENKFVECGKVYKIMSSFAGGAQRPKLSLPNTALHPACDLSRSSSFPSLKAIESPYFPSTSKREFTS